MRGLGTNWMISGPMRGLKKIPHTTILLLFALLSAWVQRFSVSCMRDFLVILYISMLYVRHLVNLKEIPIQIYPRMSHMQPVCSSGRKKQHGSLIYFVPRGVMAFAARSATNSLASPDNLARWKKIVHPKCPLCQIPPCTLGHLLSNCQQALTRYEWRHNNIVKYLHSTATSQGMEAYADLEGC